MPSKGGFFYGKLLRIKQNLIMILKKCTEYSINYENYYFNFDFDYFFVDNRRCIKFQQIVIIVFN